MSSNATVSQKKEANPWTASILSFVLFLIGLSIDQFKPTLWSSAWLRFTWYGIAYLPVALPVLKKGFQLILKGEFFTEFFLMSIATLGAFYLGEYPEGVAVMLFYTIGELLQELSVKRAKKNIKALLDIRPEVAFVKRGNSFERVNPRDVQVEDILQVKVGERVPLDGRILTKGSYFNTVALTGESKASYIETNETVLAGMVNEESVVEIQVTKPFEESAIARILKMVESATSKKAATELFIRKFAKIYTPIVVYLAIAITLLPYFFINDYTFREWLYRALVFLVISCPCALVVAIPLGYFGGLGAASRNGILIKGSNYLDVLTTITHVVMDKTGTLTKGNFVVQETHKENHAPENWLDLLSTLEQHSNHPIAKAVVNYHPAPSNLNVRDVQEHKGLGITGMIGMQRIIAGNPALLIKEGIHVPNSFLKLAYTLVLLGVDNQCVGYVTIADDVKADSKTAIERMHKLNLNTIMLSGDKRAVVEHVANYLGIDKAYGDLLPEDKVLQLEELKKDKSHVVCFVGDGINDAPVLALSDVGIAMGGLGSDVAIETADVVIQTDQPSKIPIAIAIGKATKQIVWQNITLAFAVKLIVLLLGGIGIASLWEAVFADVGVALLAILNAIRIQHMNFK
jgi:Cd2+/Zn2+-exporting ATPase